VCGLLTPRPQIPGCWIPASAGMAEKRAGDGFYTDWQAEIPRRRTAIPAPRTAIPVPHLAIPAKAGIQHIKRALRAPFKAGAGRPAPQCARSALNLRGIPAFAGMTEKNPGMAGKTPSGEKGAVPGVKLRSLKKSPGGKQRPSCQPGSVFFFIPHRGERTSFFRLASRFGNKEEKGFPASRPLALAVFSPENGSSIRQKDDFFPGDRGYPYPSAPIAAPIAAEELPPGRRIARAPGAREPIPPQSRGRQRSPASAGARRISRIGLTGRPPQVDLCVAWPAASFL